MIIKRHYNTSLGKYIGHLDSSLCSSPYSTKSIQTPFQEQVSSFSPSFIDCLCCSLAHHILNQWFSKCGPRTSNISITWELVEMQILRLHPRPTDGSGDGTQNSTCFHKPFRWFWCRLRFDSHCIRRVTSPPASNLPRWSSPHKPVISSFIEFLILDDKNLLLCCSHN